MKDLRLFCGLSVLAGVCLGMTIAAFTFPKCEVQALKAEVGGFVQARKVEDKGAEIVTQTGKAVSADAAKVRGQTREVIRYVQNIPPAIADQPLPTEFVLGVNAAITGDVSGLAEGAGQPDEPVAPVTTAEGALTLADNFGTCREAMTRAAAWPVFYDQVRATYNKGK